MKSVSTQIIFNIGSRYLSVLLGISKYVYEPIPHCENVVSVLVRLFAIQSGINSSIDVWMKNLRP